MLDSLPAPLPDLLSIEQVAAYLVVPERNAHELIRDGKIPTIKVGNEHRITRENLLRFIDRHPPSSC